MRLALYVEGETEKYLPEFLKRWLDQRLQQRIGVRAIPFEGVADYLRHFASRVTKDLDQGRISGAIGLIDFYGSGLAYPNGTVEQKYRWAKQELEGRVSNPRFRQHFAVHETEAWLLSDPAIFSRDIAGDLPSTSNPETVNFDNPPSYRLKDLYNRRLRKKSKKPIEGSSLFRKLDPELACTRCPHLSLLLNDMLGLAQEALKHDT